MFQILVAGRHAPICRRRGQEETGESPPAKAREEQRSPVATALTVASKVETESPEAKKKDLCDWDETLYLKTYLQREKTVLEGLYGEGWSKYLKHPELPRKKYYVEQRRRDSSEERRRQKEQAQKAKKKKGGSIFRKY